jgi:hypothetical protein
MNELELGRIIERLERRMSDHEMMPHAAIDHTHDMSVYDELATGVRPLLEQAAAAAAEAEAAAAAAAVIAETETEANAAEEVANAAAETEAAATEAAEDSEPAREHALGRRLFGG